MSRDDETRIEEVVETVVAKYSFRNLRAIVVITFLAAGWATTLQIQLNRIGTSDEKQEASTVARVTEWTTWRTSVDHELRQVNGNTSDRWKRSHMRTFAHDMSINNPTFKVPDVDVIANKQP